MSTENSSLQTGEYLAKEQNLYDQPEFWKVIDRIKDKFGLVIQARVNTSSDFESVEKTIGLAITTLATIFDENDKKNILFTSQASNFGNSRAPLERAANGDLEAQKRTFEMLGWRRRNVKQMFTAKHKEIWKYMIDELHTLNPGWHKYVQGIYNSRYGSRRMDGSPVSENLQRKATEKTISFSAWARQQESSPEPASN